MRLLSHEVQDLDEHPILQHVHDEPVLGVDPQHQDRHQPTQNTTQVAQQTRLGLAPDHVGGCAVGRIELDVEEGEQRCGAVGEGVDVARLQKQRDRMVHVTCTCVRVSVCVCV